MFQSDFKLLDGLHWIRLRGFVNQFVTSQPNGVHNKGGKMLKFPRILHEIYLFGKVIGHIKIYLGKRVSYRVFHITIQTNNCR